jgi:uncharacterized protein YdiU (UPF0061 family)
VVTAQARLVAQWMLVGFVHGVMNTDNMTISGETIDYGPFAFLDAFDPSTVYSSIDTGGRYAYANQPLAAEWDLARLAEALLPLLHPDEPEAVALAVASLETFRPQYSAAWSAGMRAKLGLGDDVPDDVAAPLVAELLPLLQDARLDHTTFFRSLVRAADAPPPFVVLGALDAWRQRWHALHPDAALMSRANPVYIPRNHLVEEALGAATAGDLDPLHRLLDAVTRPYDERPGLERYAAPPAEDVGPYRTFCGT